jgi:bifunctional non-homologous end joining protein LigD
MLPKWIRPQLSRPVDEAPAGPDWLHEIKYDGYRMHARLEGGRAQLLTRTGLDWSQRYRHTQSLLRALPLKTAYLDGELCALSPDGVPAFSRLQAAMDEGCTDDLVFIVFDLLFLDGKSMAELPLLSRKERLRSLLPRDVRGLRYRTSAGQRAAYCARSPTRDSGRTSGRRRSCGRLPRSGRRP